jgi:hypothetical protein
MILEIALGILLAPIIGILIAVVFIVAFHFLAAIVGSIVAVIIAIRDALTIRNIVACVILVLMMACGEEEEKKKDAKTTEQTEQHVIDPGEVEIARFDVTVYAFLSTSATIRVGFAYNSLLSIGNLDYYGWSAVVAISDKEFPKTCDASSYREEMEFVYIKSIPPGKYYARACAVNRLTGIFSKGITKEFNVEVIK